MASRQNSATPTTAPLYSKAILNQRIKSPHQPQPLTDCNTVPRYVLCWPEMGIMAINCPDMFISCGFKYPHVRDLHPCTRRGEAYIIVQLLINSEFLMNEPKPVNTNGPPPAGPLGGGDYLPRLSFWKKHGTSIFWAGITVLVGAGLGVGSMVGDHFTSTAQQHQDCAAPSPKTVASWQGRTVSGAPTSLQSSFGYGRGTQVIESYILVTGAKLPEYLAVSAMPLVTSDGTQIILPIQSKGKAPAAISAVAIQMSGSIYRLEVCITAPNAAPGSYVSQLFFPGASSSAGNGSSATTPAPVPVTVTFQAEAVPYILTMGIVPLALFGMIYCTLILVRRADSNQSMSGLPAAIREALWSVNGIFAFVVSIGAVFAAWNLQCYRDPTWGTPWPVILTALATMAGAAAGASTVPMGLSKNP